MLACCRKDGICPVTTGGLSRLANITIEQAEDALRVLSSPDKDTLTQEHEGRRIERVDSGWKLLNWDKYREQARKQILREQNRAAQARYRDRVEEYIPDQEEAGNGHPKQQWVPTPEQLRLGKLFKRRETTPWSEKEIKAWKLITPVAEEDMDCLENYYRAKIPDASNFRRRDLGTLLNNFSGELDRARKFKNPSYF